MELNEYQHRARATAVYPRIGQNLQYPVLGLAGEAGEICNKVKKIERDCGGKITPEIREKILKEVGDTLWYVSMICQELAANLDDVARDNLMKLLDRQSRGVLKGSGDER